MDYGVDAQLINPVGDANHTIIVLIPASTLAAALHAASCLAAVHARCRVSARSSSTYFMATVIMTLERVATFVTHLRSLSA